MKYSSKLGSNNKTLFNIFKSVGMGLTLIASSSYAFADTGTVKFAYQNGTTYLPLMLMEKNKTFEKHAKALGIADAKAEYTKMSGPGPINDALIGEAVQFGAVGNSSLPLLYEKTRGKFKAVGSLSYMPLYLNTTNPSIKSVADFTEKDKIALPTVKQSVQAVTLQMAVAQKFGQDKFATLDNRTVSMSHPEAAIAMLGGKSAVNSHFTAPPFQYQELNHGKGKVRTILNSYEVLGGKASFVLLVGNVKFVTENPTTYKAIVGALEETTAWINANKSDAAKQYIEISKSNEPLKEVLDQISSPEVEFNVVPRGLMKYAEFMNKVGTLKSVPTSWKELCFPNLHNKAGS
jgi:NitT/TauT family transport system substrate-binding protein